MSNFEEVPESVIKMMDDEITNNFSTIVNARIKILYNMKKKTSQGALVFGTMSKATPILNYLTSSSDSADDGYNYIMFLDGNVFPAIDVADQKRIIRHELNHIFIDLDAKNPYKIVGHEINDFYKEIEYNKDEPRWLERVTAVAEQVYDSDDD